MYSFFLFLRVFSCLPSGLFEHFVEFHFDWPTVLLSVCLYIVKEEYSVTLVRGDKAGFVQDHRCGYRHHCSGILQFVGRVAPSDTAWRVGIYTEQVVMWVENDRGNIGVRGTLA